MGGADLLVGGALAAGGRLGREALMGHRTKGPSQIIDRPPGPGKMNTAKMSDDFLRLTPEQGRLVVALFEHFQADLAGHDGEVMLCVVANLMACLALSFAGDAEENLEQLMVNARHFIGVKRGGLH